MTLILYDFSSCVHRALHTSIKHTNPHKKDGKYITDEFISVMIYRIVSEFVEFSKQYKNEYGGFIVCLDDHSKPYWKKTIYPEYKANRSKEREESDVDFGEMFKHIDLLIKVLKNYTNFKVIGVPGTEADDIIGLLTRKFSRFEKVLILSPDKDFKQLHKLGNIRQYSSITNKWIEMDDVDEFVQEHICLGDATDNVPRIVDFIEFTNEFKEHIQNKYNELEFYELDYGSKQAVIGDFEGQIYNKIRFGPSGLKKKIQEYGSLDNFLDSNPILRKTYELNKRLVLDSELPAKVEADILAEYTKPSAQIDIPNLTKYFEFYKLQNSCLKLFKELTFSTGNTKKFDALTVNFDNI